MAVNFDKDTDYQALINAAVEKGDYAAAAKAEQQRNAKIDYLNSTGGNIYSDGYKTTNYAKYLGDGYQATGTHKDADMSASDLAAIDSLRNQYYVASSLNDEATMNALHEAAEAIRAGYGYSGGGDGSEYIKLEKATTSLPTYTSKYSSQIDSLLNTILNREEFSYDHTTDPTYQAYEQKYKRLGDRAREDTLGDVAALNGGYASSWAASAASQAQNDYNQQLADIIPTLYDAAYNRYLNEDSLNRSDLGLIMDLDNTDYGRYRDTVSDSQWQQQFDKSNEQWDKNFSYNVAQDSIANNQWQQSFDESNRQWQQSFNWDKTVDDFNMKAQEQTTQFNQMMDRWSITGVADSEVAAYFGIPEGTTTESYYFNKASQALDQEKFEQSKKTDEAENQPNHMEESIARTAKNMMSKAESYQPGVEYILSAVTTADEYYRVGAAAGIPTSVLQEAFDAFYSQALEDGNTPDTTKDYAYYAALMGQAEDPEAWLVENKYSIPADILKDLYALLDYN